jgi:hypothetical protein
MRSRSYPTALASEIAPDPFSAVADALAGGLSSTRSSFGRSISEITRTTSDEDAVRRATQQRLLVEALSEQVRERDAARLVGALRRWDDEQAELESAGLRGSGKPRPDISLELVPYVAALEPALLAGTRHALYVYAGPGQGGVRGAASALPGSGFALRPVEGHPSALAHTLPGVGGGGVRGGGSLASPLRNARGGAAGSGEAEARLERLLAAASPIASPRPLVRGDSFRGAEGGLWPHSAEGGAEALHAPSSSSAGGGGGDVGALTALVQLMLAEQRALKGELRERLETSTTRGGHREEAHEGRPAIGGAHGVKAKRAGGGGRGERPDSALSTGTAGTRPRSTTPRAGARRLGAGVRDTPPSPPPPVPHRAAPKAATGPPKRPVFGRHEVGTLSAVERRARGDVVAAEAAEKRRATLEAFREAEAEAKAAKRREAEMQRSLRRAIPFHRAAVVSQSPPGAAAELGGREGGGWPPDSALASPARMRRGGVASSPPAVDNLALDSPGVARYGGGGELRAESKLVFPSAEPGERPFSPPGPSLRAAGAVAIATFGRPDSGKAKKVPLQRAASAQRRLI